MKRGKGSTISLVLTQAVGGLLSLSLFLCQTLIYMHQTYFCFMSSQVSLHYYLPSLFSLPASRGLFQRDVLGFLRMPWWVNVT